MFAQRCSSDCNRGQVFMKRSVRAAQTWHSVKSRGSEAKALSGWGPVDRWWWGSGGGWCRKEVSPASDQEKTLFPVAARQVSWQHLAFPCLDGLFDDSSWSSATFIWPCWTELGYLSLRQMERLQLFHCCFDDFLLPQRQREVTTVMFQWPSCSLSWAGWSIGLAPRQDIIHIFSSDVNARGVIIGTTDEGIREVCSMINDILWSTWCWFRTVKVSCTSGRCFCRFGVSTVGRTCVLYCFFLLSSVENNL